MWQPLSGSQWHKYMIKSLLLKKIFYSLGLKAKHKLMACVLQYLLRILFMVFSLLAVAARSQDDQVSIQIVYMVKSKDSTASHVATLASVLGSEMAAKKAIIYEYQKTLNGFAAKLTSDQINALLKEPAVLKILPDGTRKADMSASASTP